jgi:vacuolar protein sorting-associated protein 18
LVACLSRDLSTDRFLLQIKDFAPSSTLRRILALQTALVRPSDKLPLSSLDPSSAVIPSRVSQPRALLSSSFDSSAATGVSSKHKNKDAANGVAGATNPSSRRAGLGILAAGDRLRELILPDALATAIGGLPKNSPSTKAQSMQAVPATTEKLEKMREELDGLLAGSCVLCDSVVAGLDKPFLMSGEEEEGEWAI